MLSMDSVTVSIYQQQQAKRGEQQRHNSIQQQKHTRRPFHSSASAVKMLFPLLGTPLTMGMREATTNSKEIKAIGSGAALDCSITFLPVDASTTTAAANPSIASLQLMTSGAALHKNVLNPNRDQC